MCKHTPGFFNLCTCETLKAVTLKVAGKIVQGQRRENSNTLRKKKNNAFDTFKGSSVKDINRARNL